MRERQPRSGFGALIVLAIVFAGIYFGLKNILEKFPHH
jgi:hypothetical protein